jgi:hypothetical protein
MRPTRREVLTGGLALALLATAGHRAAAAPKPEIIVYKSPT